MIRTPFSASTYVAAKKSMSGFTSINKGINVLKYVQQHRAICLSVIGGASIAGTSIKSAQKSVEKYLLELHGIEEFSEIISGETLLTEWQCIKRSWGQYSALDAFEVHNFLIDRILLVIRELAKATGLFTASRQHFLLSDFCFNHLVLYCESLGKLRGLSVYASTSVAHRKEVAQRLHHIHKSCAEAQREHTQRVQRWSLNRSNPSLGRYRLQTSLKLSGQFLDKVQRDFLTGDGLSKDSDNIFLLATRAIETELTLLQWAVALLESESLVLPTAQRLNS